MTTTFSKGGGVGCREVQVILLDANGLPALEAGKEVSGDQGFLVVGPRAVTINRKEPKRVYHKGADRVLATFVLPPDELPDGELKVAAADLDFKAYVSDQLVATVGEHKYGGMATDKAGYEPYVMLLALQIAKDENPASTNYNQQGYHWFLIPKCQLIDMGNSMDDNPTENTFKISASNTKKYINGIAFSEVTNGFTETALLEGFSLGKLRVIRFEGTGSEDEFVLSPEATAAAKVTVYKEATAGAGDYAAVTGAAITIAVGKITFTAAPADGAGIIVLLEV
jgi:hypothetical protein